jgi:hypothetical protein
MCRNLAGDADVWAATAQKADICSTPEGSHLLLYKLKETNTVPDLSQNMVLSLDLVPCFPLRWECFKQEGNI